MAGKTGADPELSIAQPQRREGRNKLRVLEGKAVDGASRQGADTFEHPEAVHLVRFTGNPILGPVRDHPWESRYVLNPGVIKLNGKIHLVYRAVGEDGISRLGLAASEDGLVFDQRLEAPIFAPEAKSEAMGCEDPRLTLIDDRVYMLYTAYDGFTHQIAMASIRVDDFLNYRWGAWCRHGLVFPGTANKNAALFPERLNGKFTMLHRITPDIWIGFSPHLHCPWPGEEHAILARSASGHAWEATKIGAGSPPLKTRYGWLLLTHGVDSDHVYRLGAMLLDLADPTVVLYRSPNSILAPEDGCETGQPGASWVQNVVFTCGVAPALDGERMLDAESVILVYYGAADSVICVAQARVGDLIPGEQCR